MTFQFADVLCFEITSIGCVIFFSFLHDNRRPIIILWISSTINKKIRGVYGFSPKIEHSNCDYERLHFHFSDELNTTDFYFGTLLQPRYDVIFLEDAFEVTKPCRPSENLTIITAWRIHCTEAALCWSYRSPESDFGINNIACRFFPPGNFKHSNSLQSC